MSTPADGSTPTMLSIPATVLAILQRLEEAGYSTWCVGGAIRDALLGGVPQDVDLATAATPAQVRALFPRTVPVGIEHGTIGVLDPHGVLHEVTTFRRDVTTDGRHATVAFGVSLDEDLARRDFTINAIAWHPLRQEWCDPFNGRADLAAGVIRAVGDPTRRFDEDRLRILRAVRFAARFGFRIDAPTWQAMGDRGRDTTHLSAERVRDEWVKSLRSARLLATLVALWDTSGIAAAWLPELRADAPVWRALDAATDRPIDPVLLTAIGAVPSGPAWRRFKGSSHEIRRAEAIDRGPTAPVSDDPVAVRRWLARVGNAAEDLAQVARWRGVSPGSAPLWLAVMQSILDRGEATTRGALAVTGHDLVAEGVVSPGPAMGGLLDRLLDLVLDDPALNQRDLLLDRARALR